MGAAVICELEVSQLGGLLRPNVENDFSVAFWQRQETLRWLGRAGIPQWTSA